jgi:hypothetical protein
MEMTMEGIRLYEAAVMPDRAHNTAYTPDDYEIMRAYAGDRAAGDCGHTYAEREADFNRWRRRHDTMVMTDVIALAFGLDAGDRERLRARLDGIDAYSDEDVMWVLMNHMRPHTTPATERTDADPLDGHEGIPMASPAVDGDDGDTAVEPASTGAHVLRDQIVPAYERLL